MSEVVKGLVAGACGLVGTLITLVATWARERGGSARRIRILDEATKRITFWETCLRVNQAIGAQGEDVSAFVEQARNEMRAAVATVEYAFHESEQTTPTAITLEEHSRLRSSLSVTRRWLLLYKPVRVRSWVPRVLFYTSSAALFVVPTVEIVFHDDDWFYMLLGILFWALVFYALSLWSERPS